MKYIVEVHNPKMGYTNSQKIEASNVNEAIQKADKIWKLDVVEITEVRKVVREIEIETNIPGNRYHREILPWDEDESQKVKELRAKGYTGSIFILEDGALEGIY